MSVDNFIPQIWSARIMTQAQKALVFGNYTNREYEGEIREAGDTVVINGIGPVTIGNYVKNSTTITPEELNDNQTLLKIDQCKYFAFKVDDVDRRQAQGDLISAAMDDAAYGLANAADSYIASLYTQAGSVTADVEVDSSNALEILLALAQALDEANCPTNGRYCICPPWMRTKLTLAKVIVENQTNSALEERRVYRIAGFDVEFSNNVAVANNYYKVMAGVRNAIAFAGQLRSVEAYRPENSFSDAVKGLYLFGSKVVLPDFLAVASVKPKAES